MKILYLVRHAKAIPADVGVTDFKRALSKTGKNDAQAMSKRLQKRGIRPELLISSPADRTLETAHIFAEKLGYPIRKIVLRDEIYDEDEKTLKEIIKGVEDRYTTVMLFGHNPSLSDLARDLLPDFEMDIRKAGVVGIGFETSSWQEISAESATLLLFDFPVRATPKIHKKAQKAIKNEITSTIENILENIDAGASKHLEKIVQKTSKKLAKELLKVLQASKVEQIVGIKKLARVDNLSPKDLQTSVIQDKEEIEEPTQKTPMAKVTEEEIEVSPQQTLVVEVTEEEVETPIQETQVTELIEEEVEMPSQETSGVEVSGKTLPSRKKTTGNTQRRSRRRAKRKTTDKKAS